MNRLVKMLVCISAIAAAFYGCGLLIDRSISVQRDVYSYELYLSEFPEKRLLTHFPKLIHNPRKASVAFFTGALQGGAFIQLRLKLNVTEVAEIEKSVASTSIAKYNGGRCFTHFNLDQDNNYPTTCFYTIDDDPDGFQSFPGHFALYVLSAKQNGMDWNTTGVAVSLKWNEVVYWADYNP